MARQLRQLVSLGDIEDIEAFVRAVAHNTFPGLPPDEFEDVVADGLEIAWQKMAAIPEGESLEQRLGPLDRRLIDRRRTWYRERRGRGATRTVEVSSLDEQAENLKQPDFTDDAIPRAAVESILDAGGGLDDPNVAGRLRGLTDFGDGRYLGVPSHHPLPPTACEEYRISRQEGDGFTFR
jgi:hypothetical protein